MAAKSEKKNGVDIKKEIRATEMKEEVPEAPAPTKEDEEARKLFAEVDGAMRKFDMYPVAADENAKNEALRTLGKIYSGGDARVKQVILYVLHETLCKISEYRVAKNIEYYKKKFPQNTPVQNRMGVYGGMFNYSHSLEGLLEVVNLLSEFGDSDSTKVLTYHFSFLCAFDGSESARMLRNAVTDALGRSKSVYALRALLAYAKNVESEQLGGRVIAAVAEWKDRVKDLKIEQKEKSELMGKINELVLQETEEGHYR